MGFMDSLKKGASALKEGATFVKGVAADANQKYKDEKLNKIKEDETKRCGTCDNYNKDTCMCTKHDKAIECPEGIDGEYCIDWSDSKQRAEESKRLKNEAKLQKIHEDAYKRCAHCDHYIDGTRMCRLHEKKIENAYGPEGDFCIDWNDGMQQLKKTMKYGL